MHPGDQVGTLPVAFLPVPPESHWVYSEWFAVPAEPPPPTEWTAEYVAMRALKNPDAFPASDLGLLRAFDVPGHERMRASELATRAEAWRPWRAYAALLLWGSEKGAGG